MGAHQHVSSSRSSEGLYDSSSTFLDFLIKELSVMWGNSTVYPLIPDNKCHGL